MPSRDRFAPVMGMALVMVVLASGHGVIVEGSSGPAFQTVPGSGTKTFPETDKTVTGLFLDYWNGNGGLAQQGYPISDAMQEKSDLDGKSYTVQYFERAVFEHHPENSAPYNVLLSQLGTFAYKEKYPQGEPDGSRTLGATASRKPCAATKDDPPGPYQSNPPVKNSAGKGHILRGYVLSVGDCTPIVGAKVELWPEIAGMGHDSNDRAAVFTDEAGAYWYESRFPEHIHMRISAPGYKTIYNNSYHPSAGQTEGKLNVVIPVDEGCQVFAQTGKPLCGAFLKYWQEHGGLAQQGYPISVEFSEKSGLDGKTYVVQYFERAVFEKHPENQPPYDVLLSQLGTFRYKAKYASAGQLPANISLTDFYEKAFLNLLLRDPESFTGVGLPDSYAPDFRGNKLTDVHDAYVKATYALANQYLDKLKSYDTKAQTPQQQVSTAILEWHLDDVTRGEVFMYYDYPINPVTGVQNSLEDLMVNLQPLSNKQDAVDYVARLNDYGNKFDGVLEQLKLREQKGIFPPKWIIQSGIGQMKDFAGQDAKQNELYVYFNGKLNLMSGLNASDKQALLAGVEKAIREVIYPAYNRVSDYLGTIVSKGRDTDGVWALPNGDAYYRYTIHHYTTTDMTPEEIHNLGLSEVARVKGEMQTILDGLGYKGMSFADAMGKVGDASGYYPTTTQAEKQVVLNAFQKLIDDASKTVASQFDIKPRVGLEVRAVPVDKQEGSPGGYYFAPALDGSRPGIFYVNLGRPRFAKYAMPTLAYHEAVPGHHFQLGIQSELQNVPTFQRSGLFPTSTGYTEGWGLYAEQVMYEAGAYKDDPYGNLGRLQAELFRSARLVVDTGIHWKHWSQAEANKYMEDTLGTPPGSYAGEVARYIAWPGQALGYKIGELKMVELKKMAQQQLGSKFSVKEFHNVVLQNGTVPLEVLESLVKGYVASKR